MHLQKTLGTPIKPKNIDQIHTKNHINSIPKHQPQNTVFLTPKTESQLLKTNPQQSYRHKRLYNLIKQTSKKLKATK